ncbi:MAG TPA: GAF domain-containing protein [Candidatus Acidoferrum sp.]|nr:GAF domain-containing protein [Candidatus Acidoferrum sp.]
MNDLLQVAVNAHGGLSRWNQLKRVKANLSTTGAIFQVKGKSDVLKDVSIEAEPHKQRLTTQFNGHGTRTIFEPNRIIVETEVCRLVDSSDDPRAAFRGHTRETPWDDLTGRWFMANAKASPNLQALPTSPTPAQTLPCDAVLDALKMILLGAPLNEVLTTITRMIEAHSTGMLCSISLLDEDGLHLRYGVAASLPEAYRAANDGICIGPNVGSCGTAAYLRQPVFVSDIASDPRWVKFRHFAIQNGLRAAWSSPMLSHDRKVLGTFCMYYGEVRHPGPAEMQLIDYAGGIAGIAIERDRSQTALTRAFEQIEKSEAHCRRGRDKVPCCESSCQRETNAETHIHEHYGRRGDGACVRTLGPCRGARTEKSGGLSRSGG